MKVIKSVLLWVWQLPQHLLAFAVLAFLKLRKLVAKVEKGHEIFIFHKRFFGVSLGNYIFVPDNANLATKNHERGHSVQSQRLGPFYLLTVGIYSALFCNVWDRVFHKSWPVAKRVKWYYGRWCEAWADKLGGVNRVY